MSSLTPEQRAQIRALLAERDKLAAALEAARGERDELAKERDILRAGIVAVDSLIQESRGVDGLHLNGDVAPWDELLEGGRFEEWLIDFSIAIERASHPDAAMEGEIKT